jgi:hypothetical protein
VGDKNKYENSPKIAWTTLTPQQLIRIGIKYEPKETNMKICIINVDSAPNT